jgi:hypothetical protein
MGGDEYHRHVRDPAKRMVPLDLSGAPGPNRTLLAGSQLIKGDHAGSDAKDGVGTRFSL